MIDAETFRKALDEAFASLDDGYVHRHIGDGWYTCENMGLVFNQEFLEEVDRAVMEELKNSK